MKYNYPPLGGICGKAIKNNLCTGCNKLELETFQGQAECKYVTDPRERIKEKPIGKQRPRYSSKIGKMYTPTATRSFEEKVKWAFTSKYNVETELSEKPFKAKITAIFEPPKSISKKKREELLFKIDYTKKPDADNIAKIILDSLNGLAYKDDSQVSVLSAIKRYGSENTILVELEEVEEIKKNRKRCNTYDSVKGDHTK